FFFQAADGIRDLIVTGVQTCALPISDDAARVLHLGEDRDLIDLAVAVLIDAAQHAAAARRAAEGTLLIAGDEHLAGRRRRQRHRSEEHTSELQSRSDLVCRLLLEKKK